MTVTTVVLIFFAYLWKINTPRVDIEPVEETGEAVAKPCQALLHQLKVHEIGLEIGHRVCQFGKRRLERSDWVGGGIETTLAWGVGRAE